MDDAAWELRLLCAVLTPPEKYASPFQPPPEDIAPAVSNSEGDFKPGPVVCHQAHMYSSHFLMQCL